MENRKYIVYLFLLVFSVGLLTGLSVKTPETFASSGTITITDAWGREVKIPKEAERVICSGPGSLRYLTYLEAHDSIVAVDGMEKSQERFKARPYALANPRFKKYPLFGEFRGHDNPELIAALDPQPQVIFKAYGRMGYDPDELQAKTGIPVIVLEYGDLVNYRSSMNHSLRIMGRVMGEKDRAESVISFFDLIIKELDRRTKGIPDSSRKTCYIGGIALKGPHGFQSTEPAYPPFLFTNSRNLAYDPDKGPKELRHADVSKEKIVQWDPDIIFVDLSTIMSDPQADAVYELKHDPAFSQLSAVKSGNVYGLLPYNWYTQNYGSIIADAFYVGKVLYPERFKDIDPKKKADELYEFLVGKPVFDEMNNAFGKLVFSRIPF